MRIGAKLTISFSLIIVVFTIGILFSWIRLQETTVDIQKLEQTSDKIITLARLEALMEKKFTQINHYILDKDQDAVSEFEKTSVQLGDVVKQINEGLVDSKQKSLFTKIIKTDEELNTLFREKMVSAVALKQESNIESIKKSMYSAREEIGIDFTNLNELIEKDRHLAHSESQEHAQKSIIILFVVLGIAIFCSIVIGYIITRRITTPIVQVMKVAKQVAKGNLQVTNIVVRSKDEVGALAISINEMMDHLRTLVGKIHVVTNEVAVSSDNLIVGAKSANEASNHIVATFQEVASRADIQFRDAENSKEEVEKMSDDIQSIATTSIQVSEIAIETTLEAIKGNEAIQNAINQMGLLSKTLESSAAAVEQLGQRSQEIEQIVNLISDISSQTNLLALNAAIEAARAGQHGKGFAVVADEVRKLAEQTVSSTAQISNLVHNIRKDTEVAVSTMDSGIIEARIGMEGVTNAGYAFTHILRAAQRVADQVQDISKSTQQISIGSKQVVSSVDNITRISKETAYSSKEVSSYSEEQLASINEIFSSAQVLKSVVDDLQKGIDNFSV